MACEFSGIVRNAFRRRGHDVVSCDLLPSETFGHHIQADVRRFLRWRWDLLIAHPPCTHLSVSGARWFKDKLDEQREALAFVDEILNAPIERIALENPVSIISSRIRRPDQVVQPWMFGHDASKATCLWLKNLPPLTGTDVLPGGHKARRANQTPSGQNRLGPSPTRAQDRSRTYPGLADAMAEQWGALS